MALHQCCLCSNQLLIIVQKMVQNSNKTFFFNVILKISRKYSCKRLPDSLRSVHCYCYQRTQPSQPCHVMLLLALLTSSASTAAKSQVSISEDIPFTSHFIYPQIYKTINPFYIFYSGGVPAVIK